jgi:transcriptional regulator with XRE-family HTH domain
MSRTATASALKKWRMSNGYTLDAAAAAVGTVRQVWFDWENGRRRPNASALEQIFILTQGAIQPNDFYDVPRWRRMLAAIAAAVASKAA